MLLRLADLRCSSHGSVTGWTVAVATTPRQKVSSGAERSCEAEDRSTPAGRMHREAPVPPDTRRAPARAPAGQRLQDEPRARGSGPALMRPHNKRDGSRHPEPRRTRRNPRELVGKIVVSAGLTTRVMASAGHGPHRCRLAGELRVTNGRCCDIARGSRPAGCRQHPNPPDPGGAMKTEWTKPVLVLKPLSETAQGLGSNQDGIGGEFPIPPS